MMSVLFDHYKFYYINIYVKEINDDFFLKILTIVFT